MSHQGFDELLGELAGWAAMGIEAVMIALIVFGAAAAAWSVARLLMQRKGFSPLPLRDVWLRFAAWILLGTEFALAADLIRTVIAPSWEELGKLATIAVIRTVLGFALGHDIMEAREAKRETST